jgi:SAM-dependent methyltransferase
VDFTCADAQEYAFGRGSFDLIVSRFGVMFFADSRSAFENLNRAAKKKAELCVIAWRGISENPFMTAAERAVASILPGLAARDLDGPGQFRFADAKRVRPILEASGWYEIDIRPIDRECSFPERELMRYVTLLGPLGRALRDVDEATKARVLAAVRPAFAPYVQGDTVRFNAACWKIGATA